MKGLLVAVVLCVGCSNSVSTTTQSAATKDEGATGVETTSESIVLSIEAVDETAADSERSLVKFVVTNTADKAVSWLSWNSPFEEPLSANIFKVSLDGVPRDYQGRLIKRGQPLPEHYMTLPASDSVHTFMNIARYYDVSESGAYTVQLDMTKLTSIQQPAETPDVSVSPAVVTLQIP